MHTIGFSFDNSYSRLPERLYTRLDPIRVKDPQVVIINHGLAAEMGLDLSGRDSETLAALFAGNRLPPGAEPLAQAYAGHQFGHFTLLGDGRAIVLGEHLTPDGRRLDLQYKGSGQTPYSRNGDGRAALGPMLREYIISEAMHALGIPTTRSLAVVTTGEPVFRETILTGAVLTRVAASHIRVGTFQYLALKDDRDLLKTLVDYTLKRHYPEQDIQENPAMALLKGVISRQVDLIVHWMRVGFIHGVMNTDNATLSGQTIDYGPCAFMDSYHPATVFSSIDHGRRYAFGNQPHVAQWNCARFAETLLPLLDDDHNHAIKMATEVVEDFMPLFDTRWMAMMRSKLGLTGEEQEDRALVETLLGWMKRHEADYTETFRALTHGLSRDLAGDSGHAPHAKLPDPLSHDDDFVAWYTRWRERLLHHGGSQESACELMQRSNPVVIPRNHKVEEALSAASDRGDPAPMNALQAALAAPYRDRPELAPFQKPPKDGGAGYRTFCGT